ncbi:AOX1A, partial [Symbiodinium pilosum]
MCQRLEDWRLMGYRCSQFLTMIMDLAPHRHEFYRDAAVVARVAVRAAPLFLEHWIRLGIVLAHPSLKMPREAMALVRQAMILNNTHNCLLGLKRMLSQTLGEAGDHMPASGDLLERALGGANATRQATANSREAALWGHKMRHAQKRCKSPEAAASEEGFKSWLRYGALLRSRGWLMAALGVCMHLEELYLTDGRPEALRAPGEAVLHASACRGPLESLLFHSHAGFWGANWQGSDFERRAPSAQKLLSEEWLQAQEATTYDNGQDFIAAHMQSLALRYSSAYRAMIVSGTAAE